MGLSASLEEPGCGHLIHYRSWSDVPPHLATKTQLAREGYRPLRGVEPEAVVLEWFFFSPANADQAGKVSPWVKLFDRHTAVLKRASEAQLQALAKARHGRISRDREGDND